MNRPLRCETLEIRQVPMRYELNGTPAESVITEFFVDGTPLAALLGIERNLSSSGTDLDEAARRLHPEFTAQRLEVLSGRRSPTNQFRSDRAVLYRCHCGCDYCGIVSCRIVETADHIEWHCIAMEDDEGPILAPNESTPRPATPIPMLRFHKDQYTAELLRFTTDGVLVGS